MIEGAIKTKLTKQLRQALPLPQWVVLRHEDQYRFGIPDYSITGCGWTSWWEVKYVTTNRTLRSKGIQQRLANQLNNAGYCRYIVYCDMRSAGYAITLPSISIVCPYDIVTWRHSTEARWEGWSSDALIQFIREVHERRVWPKN